MSSVMSKKAKVELRGSINEFGLSDIVQFLSGSRKTGRLDMSDAERDRRAYVFFQDGSIVHAQVDGRTGEEAFFELMRWTHGEFSFEPDATSEESSVRLSGANLLMEGARRSDEWELLSKYIPDLDWIPEFIEPDDSQTGKQIMLNTSEWIVLSKIDGERSVKDLARAANITEYNTCRLLYPLVANHLIRLREPSR
jgi:hypothetical protein